MMSRNTYTRLGRSTSCAIVVSFRAAGGASAPSSPPRSDMLAMDCDRRRMSESEVRRVFARYESRGGTSGLVTRGTRDGDVGRLRAPAENGRAECGRKDTRGRVAAVIVPRARSMLATAGSISSSRCCSTWGNSGRKKSTKVQRSRMAKPMTMIMTRCAIGQSSNRCPCLHCLQ